LSPYEHRKEVELHKGKKYTRSTGKQSQSEQNKPQSQTMSTQKITSLTQKRQQLSARNLIAQHAGSQRPSKSNRKPKTS